jgi:hypothetical protein
MSLTPYPTAWSERLHLNKVVKDCIRRKHVEKETMELRQRIERDIASLLDEEGVDCHQDALTESIGQHRKTDKPAHQAGHQGPTEGNLAGGNDAAGRIPLVPRSNDNRGDGSSTNAPSDRSTIASRPEWACDCGFHYCFSFCSAAVNPKVVSPTAVKSTALNPVAANFCSAASKPPSVTSFPPTPPASSSSKSSAEAPSQWPTGPLLALLSNPDPSAHVLAMPLTTEAEIQHRREAERLRNQVDISAWTDTEQWWREKHWWAVYPSLVDILIRPDREKYVARMPETTDREKTEKYMAREMLELLVVGEWTKDARGHYTNDDIWWWGEFDFLRDIWRGVDFLREEQMWGAAWERVRNMPEGTQHEKDRKWMAKLMVEWNERKLEYRRRVFWVEMPK